MFGDMMGMMGKLKETQQKIEETKKRLDNVTVEESAANGMVKVTITANREIKDVFVDTSLLTEKEQLEDFLVIALNKAIAKATQINESELAAVTKEGMPNIPGMNDLFK